MIHDLSRADFLEKVFDYEKSKNWKYQGELPCLIDFHDEACPPCTQLTPILEKLSREFSDSIIFYRVDVRIEENLSQELGVINLPTLLFCPLDDRPIVRQGAAAEDKIRALLKSDLLHN